jgi:DNA repair protein RadC
VDIASTQKIKQVGDIIGIRLLDHVIIGDGSFYSFADNDQL